MSCYPLALTLVLGVYSSMVLAKPSSRSFGGIDGDDKGLIIGIGGFGGGSQGGSGWGHGGGGGSSNNCRYWCRTPQNQYYCCENSNQNPSPVEVHPGRCPPVRPQCPPVRTFGAPVQCSNDGSCRRSEKCCYDTCLQHHTCKPSEGW